MLTQIRSAQTITNGESAEPMARELLGAKYTAGWIGSLINVFTDRIWMGSEVWKGNSLI